MPLGIATTGIPISRGCSLVVELALDVGGPRYRPGRSTENDDNNGETGDGRLSRISETHCQRLMFRRSSSIARTTDDGGLATLAFNMIRSQSVTIVPCIVISGPNPMTATSTPTQYERSGWRPSLTMRRDRLEHPEGQRLLSEGDEVWERVRGRASAR